MVHLNSRKEQQLILVLVCNADALTIPCYTQNRGRQGSSLAFNSSAALLGRDLTVCSNGRGVCNVSADHDKNVTHPQCENVCL